MEAAKDLPIEARALLRKAALLATPDDEVDVQKLAGAFELTPGAIQKQIGRYRLQSRGHWRWKLVNFPRKRRPVPEGPSVRPGDRANVERADPALAAKVRKAGYEGMGDGRLEIDDPREHGARAVPRSGREHRPARSNADVVRAYLGEWRRIVGRARPEAKPAAGQKGRPHNVAVPPSGYERRVHRVHIGARA